MSGAFGQVAAVGEFAELFTVPSIYMRLERVSEWFSFKFVVRQKGVLLVIDFVGGLEA